MAKINKIAITVTDDGSTDGPKVSAALDLVVPGLVVHPVIPLDLTPQQMDAVTQMLGTIRAAIIDKVRLALVLE